jgi:CubicO group peptidase (beta-lactamase class C family)
MKADVSGKISFHHTLQRVSGVQTAGLLLLLLFGTLEVGKLVASEAPSPALEPTLHARAMDRAAQLPRLRSLLISIDGMLVEEQYFQGTRSSDWANLKSASKSVLSVLVGIALDQGYLESLQDPIWEFFPQYLDAADAGKKKITLEDLLTMRSGLETTSNRNYGRWVQSGNWVHHVLTRRMVGEPGDRMIYSTGSSHLLSAVLTRATGMSTLDFARLHLGQPLAIRIPSWMRDPQGIYFGGNEMHMRPRAMLEIGELYLRGGRVKGRQVVSEAWVQASLKPRTQSRWSGRQYGYGWWIRTMSGHQVYYAWGYGGQFIFVVPDLQMVVVTTSSPLPGQGRRNHQRTIYDLMEHDLVPAADSSADPRQIN